MFLPFRPWPARNQPARRKHSPVRGVFEPLEQRRLLAADLRLVVTQHELFVEAQGTAWTDLIAIRNLPTDDVRITITTPGMIPETLQETYDIPTLEAIALTSNRVFTGFRLHGLGGNDTIDASGLKYHDGATLDGGEGDDTLVGGQRADTFRGGSGNDTVLEADHLDDLTQAGGPGDRDSVRFIEDVVWVGPGTGVTLVSDNIESVVGTRDNDHIDLSANPFSVTIFGGEGNDRLLGGGGDDSLDGGPGDDHLDGAAGHDVLLGGSGNDKLLGQAGDDRLEGDEGDDTIEGGAGKDQLFGHSGADFLDGGADDDTLDGGRDNDLLLGGTGHDQLLGGEGNDDLRGHAGDDTLRGGEGDDRLNGGVGADLLDGGIGKNTADYREASGSPLTVDLALGFASDGDQLVLGTLQDVEGSDFVANTLIGDAQANRLTGGPFNDVLRGGDGNDVLLGRAGDDHLRGEGGNDFLDGADGHDLLEGDGALLAADGLSWISTNGDDTLFGGAGDDVLYTHDAQPATPDAVNADLAMGGAGDDELWGDAGPDQLFGEAGIDVLWGLAGADTLHGGAHDDRLIGGGGEDLLVGGEGNDELLIEYLIAASRLADRAVVGGSGPDRIAVYGDAGSLSTLDEVAATMQLLLADDATFSDYDTVADTLSFPPPLRYATLVVGSP